MSTQELATIEGVLTYLEPTPFASNKVVQLTGGSGNYTYRIHLRNPYEGSTSLVLKHAKPHLPQAEWIPFPLERQRFESGVLTRISKLLPSDSLVTVPAVHLFDDKVNVIIMDDCGEGEHLANLKQLMIDSPPSPDVARTIGEALGEFLAWFHFKASADKELLDFLAENEAAKRMSSWATYGRLISTLSGKDELPALSDPPFDVSSEGMQVIEKLVKEVTERAIMTREGVVMGDFWPGNILVRLSPDGESVKRVYVVDWELSKAGIGSWDVGQFVAEVHLVRRFHADTASEAAASATLSAFLRAYGKESLENGKQDDLPKMTLVHVGAHLVAWSPRVPWGGEEKTRETVSEGVRYLINGYKGDTGHLRGSLIAELYM